MFKLKKIPDFVTKPNLITKLYFNYIYYYIIKVGKFNLKKTIVDYGCGYGELKKINTNLRNKSKIINYDIIPELSETNNIFNYNFCTICFVQSLYLMNKIEIQYLFDQLLKKKKLFVIAVISQQNIFNKIMSYIFNHKNFYKGTITTPKEEENLLLKNFKLIKIKNLFLSKIYFLKKTDDKRIKLQKKIKHIKGQTLKIRRIWTRDPKEVTKK